MRQQFMSHARPLGRQWLPRALPDKHALCLVRVSLDNGAEVSRVKYMAALEEASVREDIKRLVLFLETRCRRRTSTVPPRRVAETESTPAQ